MFMKKLLMDGLTIAIKDGVDALRITTATSKSYSDGYITQQDVIDINTLLTEREATKTSPVAYEDIEDDF